MNRLYVLSDLIDRCIGIFTTPELAMRYAYLEGIYQIMRGYKDKQPRIVWVNDSDLQWYGYIEAHSKEKPRDVIFTIYSFAPDQMPPEEEWLVAKSESYKPQTEVMRVISHEEFYRD